MEMFEGEVSRSQLQDHIHAPLDLVRPEFRLVKILPRGEFGHIRCEVQRVNLALKPEFQGISPLAFTTFDIGLIMRSAIICVGSTVPNTSC